MKTGNSNRNKRAVISEINVTPFVDVMLVLLIIFMVTAPMLQQNLSLSLPETKGNNIKPSKDPFVIKIYKTKKIYIGTSEIQINELEKKLKAIFKNKKDRQVYLQADTSVPYGLVAQILGEVKSSGISGINLVTIDK